MRYSLISSVIAGCITTVFADPSISTFPSSLTLSASFDPIKAAYWTGLPHHRRTPFCISPDGSKAFLAYLDSTYTTIQVQEVDPSTFISVGTAITVAGYEAAGLVCHNDGFALMATVDADSTTVALTGYATDEAPIVSIIRYTNGVLSWSTPVNGPGINTSTGETASPDANGDLTYSETAGLYGAYFVVTAYTGDASGHYGDSIQYVDNNGTRQDITGASSTFGCSHNTGIAIEHADTAPFATVCAEDQGAIWLNTDTQYMSGVKIANENTTNGVSGEPMGGMSGSYSNLALFPDTTKYIFAWQSRGSLMMEQNEWLGGDYTETSEPRRLNHNVAIATMSTKNTLTGIEASSTIGSAGDAQVNWVTESTTDDHQNVRVGAISSNLALVSWETLTSPECEPVPLSCSGTYAGTSYQFIDGAGTKVGSPVTSTTTFVSGDFATIGDKICWPYVDMTWNLNAPKASGTPVSKMSFACASSGNTSTSSSTVSTAAVASSAAASSLSIAPSLSAKDVAINPEVSMLSSASIVQSITTPIVPSTIIMTTSAISTPVDNCVANCQTTYNTCRVGTPGQSGNQAACLAAYSTCLGFLPTNAAGSLTSPTACATPAASNSATELSLVTALPVPSFFPLANSTNVSTAPLYATAAGTAASTGFAPGPTTFSTHFTGLKTKASKHSKASKSKKVKTTKTKKVKVTKTRKGGSVQTVETTAYEFQTMTVDASYSPVQTYGNSMVSDLAPTSAAPTSVAPTPVVDATSTALASASAVVVPIASPVPLSAPVEVDTAISPTSATSDMNVLTNALTTVNQTTLAGNGTTITAGTVTMPAGTTLKTLLYWLAIKIQELMG